MTKQVPEYAFTIANTKTGLSISAGTDDYKLFNKTDLVEFFAHFKQQDDKIKDPFTQIIDGDIEVVKKPNRRVRRSVKGKK